MTENWNVNAEYDDALERLNAAARAYNETIERAQKEAQDANGQSPQ